MGFQDSLFAATLWGSNLKALMSACGFRKGLVVAPKDSIRIHPTIARLLTDPIARLLTDQQKRALAADIGRYKTPEYEMDENRRFDLYVRLVLESQLERIELLVAEENSNALAQIFEPLDDFHFLPDKDLIRILRLNIDWKGIVRIMGKVSSNAREQRSRLNTLDRINRLFWPYFSRMKWDSRDEIYIVDTSAEEERWFAYVIEVRDLLDGVDETLEKLRLVGNW